MKALVLNLPCATTKSWFVDWISVLANGIDAMENCRVGFSRANKGSSDPPLNKMAIYERYQFQKTERERLVCHKMIHYSLKKWKAQSIHIHTTV